MCSHTSLLHCCAVVRVTDKDSASEREKLQKDLQNTKNALEDIKREETSPNQSSNASSPRTSGDEQVIHYIDIRQLMNQALF